MGQKDESNRGISPWRFPEIDGAHDVIRAHEGAEAVPDPHEKIESIEGVAPSPMTASQLEALAKQAEEDGYNEGYQKGLEKGETEGFQKGLDAGKAEAYAAEKQRLAEQQETLEALIVALQAPLKNTENQLEAWVLETTVQLASALVGDAIEEVPDRYKHIIEQVIQALPINRNPFTVSVATQDAEVLQALFDASSRDWNIKADDNIIRGGCRVDSIDGALDFTVTSRIQTYLDQF